MAAKSSLSFQDLFHYLSRYIKYWKLMLLLFVLGCCGALIYFTYGTPTYYSRSLISFTNLNLPVKSETSDVQGRGRYAQISFIVVSALNSKWVMERTANKLGLVESAGQYEYIRDNFVSSVRTSLLPGNMLQVEVSAYKPWLVREWPEAMIEAYREFTLEQRSKHQKVAFEEYSKEMTRLRERISDEQDASAKFEEDNQLIEQYISNNGLESLPSEMLTIKTRLDMMQQVDDMLEGKSLALVDQLSLLKKFRGSPVSVGSIVRRGVRDELIAKTAAPTSSPVASMTSDVPPASGGTPTSPLIVVPSMVEELEPWEKTERELRSALLERDHAAKTYLPGHEVMRELDKRIDRLTASMMNEREIAITSFRLEKSQLESKLEELQEKMPDYRRVLNDFDRYKQDYALMTSGRNLWETAYGQLKEKLAAMEFTGIEMRVDFDFQGFTLLRDDLPVAPNKSKLLMYALVLGVGLAGGGCFGLEKMRSTTSLVTETEAFTQLNAVGVVPLLSNPEEMERGPMERSRMDSHMDLTETFRIIRCSLPLYVARENPCQVILVSSSRPSEGKTLVSSRLAASFASSEESTLLIDADMRRGRIHRLFDVKPNAGLAGVVALRNPTPVLEAIVPSGTPGLDFLMRGEVASPRLEALGTESFKNMIDDLRKKYDRIIIDSPPLLGLADSVMISRCVDGAIFVIRAEQTTRRDVLSALEVISATQVPIYGFVLNGVDLSKIENYYYYSSYYPKYYDPSYIELENESVTT